MKIAFILDTFPTVSETFIVAQIAGVIKRGHEVDIYADQPVPLPSKIHADIARFRMIERTIYREGMPAAKWPRFRSGAGLVLRWGWRCPRLTFDSLNLFRHGWHALTLRGLHERFPKRFAVRSYDVIHCHYGPNGQRALELRDIGTLRGPVISTFHGYDVNRLPQIHGRDMYARLFKQGVLFTVGSEFMRARLLALGAPDARTVKLPMGVDLNRLVPAVRQYDTGAEFTLLTVARLVEVKGIEYALRALASLHTRCPHLRYCIAGDGPLRAELEVLTLELGLRAKVKFLGAVSQEEVAQLYATAHAFVLPGVVTADGQVEGQSVALLEAQATGLPVIASAVGGIPETLRDEVSGLLVPPRDIGALATAILNFVEHGADCCRMGRAGRAFVAENFDLENLNDRLNHLYGGALVQTSLS